MEEKELMIAAMDKAFAGRINSDDRSFYLCGLIGAYEALIKTFIDHRKDQEIAASVLNSFIAKHTPED